MRSIVFTATALKDFVDWARTDTKLHQRIATLIFDILRAGRRTVWGRQAVAV